MATLRDRLSLTDRTAHRVVASLAEAGILVQRSAGRRNRVWEASEIMDFFSTPGGGPIAGRGERGRVRDARCSAASVCPDGGCLVRGSHSQGRLLQASAARARWCLRRGAPLIRRAFVRLGGQGERSACNIGRGHRRLPPLSFRPA